jgi:hypothetical protein
MDEKNSPKQIPTDPLSTINTEQFSVTCKQRSAAELFGPGHFVGLGLRLKSEIRTRARTLRNRDFPTP